MSKYQIGDTVWHASMKHSLKAVTCPDCFGRRALRVILGDDSEVVIDCQGCSLGYNPPRGHINVDVYEAEPDTLLIDRVELQQVNGEVVALYSGEGRYHAKESDLFTTEVEARERAKALAIEHSETAAQNLKRKEKDTHTWAWNVTYHRRCIKQATRDLAYHTSKLEVALVKRKEPEVI